MLDNLLLNSRLDDNRPVAFLISVAYPEIWGAFIARCEYENTLEERDARLLQPTPSPTPLPLAA